MIRGFPAALTMITAIPVPGFVTTECDIRRAANWFPLVGLFLAGIAWSAGWIASAYLPSPVGAAFLTILPEVFTKGFHLDGLADSFDGFLSSRPRGRKLEIMRDSHIGSMGVLAIVSLLLMKFAIFSSAGPESMAILSAWSVLAGRCAMPLYIAISCYARPEGLGRLLFEHRPFFGVLIGLVVSGLFSEFFFGVCFLPLFFFGFVFVWKKICDSSIGGATGDTIGACEELTEVTSALSFLFFL